MNALPERYQHYAAPAGQPLTGPVELYGERAAIVYVPDAYGQMVPMLKTHVPVMPERTPPRDLSPLPLVDPMAARRLGAGVGGGALAAGVGYGLGQVLSGAAAIGSGALFWLAVLLVAAKLPAGGRAVRQGDTYNITNNNRWWGKTTNNL